MPALLLIILWIFCTVILLAISYSCLRSTCDPPPGDRTAAAATSTTATTSRLRSSTTAANTSRTAGGGAGRDVLSALPVFVYSTAQKKLNCAVCLTDLKEGEKGRFLPRCLHVFHVDCIDMWLATHLDCPVCRASVDPEAPELAV
ncbi:RING-H2 finger protein ATL3F [Musa troglodytarum]|uniref:RING-type E3 ubiquitin transferase n=1 Tax=Musa troglodytarum TaxID=320322 RepID=A0A9E7EHP3_9LILI|nr:RING-H2 finger protein ATL3F [Musa troglodytarum]